MHEPNDALEPGPGSPLCPLTSTDAGMSQATIMLVDDEDITLDVIQMFLEDAGYTRFIQCADSSQAAGLIERERPDIILLDLMMPGVSGFDVLEQVRASERSRHLPVVILTSSTDAPTKLRALEMGATDFLAKPVDQSELVLRVRNTLAAKAYQDRLANQDRLTGLPNRHMLRDQVEWAIDHARRYEQTGALMQIDISRFRELNDTLGPARADILLQRIATRLNEASRGSDLLLGPDGVEITNSLARSGGDEFALLLLGRLEPGCVAHVAQRLLDLINQPFEIEGQELFISACIGVALFPQDGTDIDTVQQNASIAVRALQTVEARTKGGFQFYAEDLNASARARLSLEVELRHALERDEFEVFYQPQYAVSSDTVVGTEALVRWKHPERGYVSPAQFIPLAEELGLIVELGEQVLLHACQQNRAWLDAGLEPGTVSVNVSVQQFRRAGFVQSVRDALERSALEPQRLKLEITESLLADNVERTATMLGELRQLGVKVSIDDFGTGYSSLAYLRALPIDDLKIDRSFLADVESSADSAAIVRAILALAGSLDLHVVAEGVETPGQLAFLHAHNCDTFQGFLYARPMPAAEAGALLKPRAPARAPLFPTRA
jgi:diguanylate cyclase (GGDEF)-like protein